MDVFDVSLLLAELFNKRLNAVGWELTRKATEPEASSPAPTYDDIQAMVAYGDEDDGTLQIGELTDDERLLIVRFRMTLPDVCLRCSEAQHAGLCPPESHMLTDKGELFVANSR